MATIDLTLQGKGGVGKSYVAMLLAQHYYERAHRLRCFDTDPVNRTFAGYASFDVEVVKLGERADEINPRYFDALIEQIIAAPADGAVVIDNGAATFLPFLGYMVESGMIDLVRSGDHAVRVHSVVTGGQALNDTLQGLVQIFENVADVPVVVWLNAYFGRIEARGANGEVEDFETTGLYASNRERIHALVRLPEVRKETFGHDIEQMMRQRLTFDEAIEHEAFTIMARQRLRMTWRTLQQAMKAVL